MDVTLQRRSRQWLAAAAWAAALGCGGAPAGGPPPPVQPATPYSEPAPAPGQPVAAPAPPPPGPSADKRLATEDEYQGWRYYAVYCERCHGPDALGTVDAPDLRYSVSEEGQVTADSFRVVVRKGAENLEEKKVMKGFEELLDDDRIAQVYAYVMARSEGRLAAGRPLRASPQ